MMYAPREVNQVFQNEKMEARLRELQKLADREGAIIRLTAEAESYPRKVGKGHELLKRVSYRFEVRYPHGSTGVIGDVDISVPAPGSPDQIGVDAKPGSAGPWSLL